jgi:ABC-2 type transport system ATP-binding protein
VSEPAVVARGLHKRYGTVVALDGLDLEVETGTILGLLGPDPLGDGVRNDIDGGAPACPAP